jgi:DNA polymerase III alpha subunit
MKWYHKEQFFTAMLQLSDNDPRPQEEISSLFYDCKLFGVEVVPPSIEKGNVDFELIDKKIYYGLKHIKRVGASSIQKIRSLPHSTWEEVFKHSSSLKIDVMQALILSGALDYTGQSRLAMKTQVEFMHHLTPKETDFFKCLLEGRNYIQKNKQVDIPAPQTFQDSLSFLINFINTDNTKKKIFAINRAPKLLDLAQKTLETCKSGELTIKEKAGFELFYLGVPATCTEVDIYQDNRKTHDLICAKREVSNKGIATIGIINRIVEKKDRHGNQFVFISLFDSTYLLDGVLWSDSYTTYKHLIEMGRIVYVEGVKRKDLYSIEHVEPL